MRHIAAVIAALALGACATTTPLTASNACSDKRDSWRSYSACARAQLAGKTDVANAYYRDWLDWAAQEVRSGRATDADAFAVDAQYKREIAGILAQEESERNEHRRNVLMTMGTVLMTQPAYTAPAPAFRAPVTCNNRGATITCF